MENSENQIRNWDNEEGSLQSLLDTYFRNITDPNQIKEIDKMLLKLKNKVSSELLALECGNYLTFTLSGPEAFKKFVAVSQALDKKGLVGNLINQNAPFVVECAVKLMESWLKRTIEFPQHFLQTIIRVTLQIIQMNSQIVNLVSLPVLLKLRENLIKIVLFQNCGFECSMLAGTCLVRILYLTMTSEELAQMYLKIIQNEPLWEFQDNMHKKDKQENDTENVHVIMKLVLINGLLHSHLWDVILHPIGESLLILKILPVVCNLCENKSICFQAFQCLMAWLRIFQKLFHSLSKEECPQFDALQCSLRVLYPDNDRIKNEKETSCEVKPFFCDSSPVFVSISTIIAVNWENFTQGVPELVFGCFQLLLELHVKECRFLNHIDSTINRLMEHEMALPWTVKSKYLAIAVLIDYYGLEELLQHYPFFTKSLIETLSSNPLASAGIDVYRNILQLKKKQLDLLSNDNVELAKWWRNTWLELFTDVLKKPDSLMQQNLLRLWLPATLKIIPASCNSLLQNFNKCDDISYKHSLMTVMKIGRTMGIISFKEMNLDHLREGLFHADEIVRIQAFAIICSSCKKSEPLCLEEMKLAEEFFEMNLNIDSAPFRQHLITHLKSLLIRVRDSSISFLSVAKKTKVASIELKQSIDFVDKLFKLIVSNLFPGSSYQRRRTCLDVIVIILEVFVAESCVIKHKGRVPIKTAALVTYAQQKGFWKFTDINAFNSVLCCLQDFMIENKEIAIKILDRYFDWDTLFEKEKRLALENCAYKWTCNPKPHICESGALLFSLVFKKFVLNNENYHSELEKFMSSLLSKLYEQFNTATSDILEAAKHFPLHGLIFTLKLCFSEIALSNKPITENLQKMAAEILQLIGDIIDYFLRLLAPKEASSNDNAPSFAEMGEAIEEMMINSGVAVDASNSALSMEFQLILSCCWVTLKECSYLIVKQVVCSVKSASSSYRLLDISQIKVIGDLLTKIMLKCRHKGVIEACCLATGEFCHHLLADSNTHIQNIPFDMLKRVLDFVGNNATSSVTRRSAGLPLMICAVVTNEVLAHHRPLLDHTFRILLAITATPVSENHSEVSDLPQVHAIHILKALVHDARLSQAVHLYVNSLAELCINNFNSPSWAIRNASLQLFGSVVLRMLGQKKVRDDQSLHNTLTAGVLLHHHSELMQSFLNILKNSINNKTSVHHGLIPVLSVMARLSPNGHQNNASILLELFDVLCKSLGNSSVAVRQLASNAVIALSPLDHFSLLKLYFEKLEDLSSLKTNTVHGYILLITKLLTFAHSFSDSQLNELTESIEKVIWLGEHQSYVIRSVFLRLILSVPSKLKLKFVEQFPTFILSDSNALAKQTWQPGKSEWLRLSMKIFFENVSQQDGIKFVEHCLSGNTNSEDRINGCLECTRDFFCSRSVDIDINFQLQVFLMKFLVAYPKSFHISLILETLIQLFQKENPYFYVYKYLRDPAVIAIFRAAAEGRYGLSSSALGIVALGHSINAALRASGTFKNHSDLLFWAKQLIRHSDPQQTEDLRLRAAEALCVTNPLLMDSLEKNFDANLIQELVQILFESSLNLLIDENIDVRQEATKFVSSLNRSNLPYYSFQSINTNYGLQILCLYFINKFSKYFWFIQFLWCKIQSPICVNQMHQSFTQRKDLILFDQEDINIYAEELELTRLLTMHLLKSFENGPIVPDMVNWYKVELQPVIQVASHVFNHLNEEETNSGFWCLSNIAQPKDFLNIYKYFCQVKLLLKLGLEIKVDCSKLHEIMQDFKSQGFSHFGDEYRITQEGK